MTINKISPIKGIFFLLVGPSGVGKGTILKRIKEDFKNDSRFLFPITATTRTPRDGEVDGKDYFFMSTEQFKKGIENNEFLEYAIVHKKHYYGLPKKQVFDALQKGINVIRELDIQGLWNLKKILPSKNLYSIFLSPPSIKELESRIRERSPLPEEEIQRRLESAKNEIIHSKECNITVTSLTGKINTVKIDIKNIIMNQIFQRIKI